MSRHFLRDDDLSPSEQAEVLALAAELKRSPYDTKSLAGPRTVAMIFDKQTLRTQASFSAGIAELGGFPMQVDGRLAGIGVRESVADVARVLGRQATAIVWRTTGQERLDAMAEHSGVPVVNALTDDFHPCQLLADLQTVQEHLGRLAGVTVTFLGDGACNMAHSWLLAGTTAGMHVRVSGPEGFQPRADVVVRATELAATTGGSAVVEPDPEKAALGADVLVTDTWVSMGREEESVDRLTALAPYRLTQALLDLASAEAIAMHCLPAYRDKEIAAEVMDGPRSVVWDEAENRRHAQKAILTWLLRQWGITP
ncbi:ornithine carbamoyltransferase [Nocardioides sp. LHG3406-4]|uniref:ornithine carbamoyltransferase n=1 Tax=Nocardioides sp. LHG3406-4 TaxID=2804575 RepID=UPI003CF6D75E